MKPIQSHHRRRVRVGERDVGARAKYLNGDQRPASSSSKNPASWPVSVTRSDVGANCLVRSLELGYRSSGVAAFIATMTSVGYRREGPGRYLGPAVTGEIDELRAVVGQRGGRTLAHPPHRCKCGRGPSVLGGRGGWAEVRLVDPSAAVLGEDTRDTFAEQVEPTVVGALETVGTCSSCSLSMVLSVSSTTGSEYANSSAGSSRRRRLLMFHHFDDEPRRAGRHRPYRQRGGTGGLQSASCRTRVGTLKPPRRTTDSM